jgi:hypothetical protein
MAGQDQLEIIAPNGQIEFFDLDPDKGVANIGRHPDNDIVIDSPGVAPFHAVLDHQQRPYRIMILSEEGEIRLGGQRLAANIFHELDSWDTLEVDGHSLILLEGAGTAVSREAGRPPTATSPAVPVHPLGQAPVPAKGAPVSPPAPASALPRMPDQVDDVIVTEISEREWTIDVEQTATCQVTIVNGGNIVATFDVRVQGLSQEWVTITPAKVNLNEGARATISIFMTPPRQPESRAGAHRLTIVVTSPNYPGHTSRTSATLIVNPYYEFSVGDLAPKQQTVSWFGRSGAVTVPVTNQGNSETPFRLDGEDDEHGCQFEFDVPGESVSLVKQAEMRLSSAVTHLVPIRVTPIRRRLIALRSRHYSFTITTTMVEGAQMPRTVMGRLKSTPLIGPWLILMMLILLAALLIFFVRPASHPALGIDTAVPARGQPVALTYDALRFPGLSSNNLLNHQNALFARLTLQYQPARGDWQVLKASTELEGLQGTVTDTPLENGRYRLLVQSWISDLIPLFEGKSAEVPVYVQPIEPAILEFKADRDAVLVGDTVTLYWKVSDAETLSIEHNGIEESLKDDELVQGQRSYTIEDYTTFTLIAANGSWPTPVKAPLSIRASMATPTPIPTPVIVRFDVEPLEITAGDTIQIDWAVTGADSVTIDPVDQGLPLEGNIGQQPTTLTTYQLTAFKSAPDGTQVKNSSILKQVIVNPEPTATTVPLAPVVEIFEITPKEVVLGNNQVVKLTWSVAGAFTKIEITNPDLLFSTTISRTGAITVTPKETTLYVLTAFNGDLSASAPVEATVLEPTPLPTVPPTAPPPTATPPPPIISYFSAEGVDPSEDKVVFQGVDSSNNWPVYLYAVDAGSHVQLSWGVKDADMVTLEDLGTQKGEGSLVLPDAVVRARSYLLTAENYEGKNKVYASIEMDVSYPAPPPPPLQVTGIEDAAAETNTIKWSYKPDDRDSIIGFRIYRADVPPGSDFVAVWPEYSKDAQEWTDSVSPTCGRAYYVVAIYMDLVNNVEKETTASGTSWNSKTCNP